MAFFRKIFSPMVWVNLLLMAAFAVLLVVGAWYGMAAYTRHGESVEVPNVKNMLLADAQYTLAKVGIEAVVVDSTYNRSLPPGSVLDQRPAFGRLVKEGREIALTVNKGQVPTLLVPDIADNSSLREAEARLKSLGFKLGPIEYVDGDKDWVMAVKCQGKRVVAGDRVPIDCPIVLVVGNNAMEDGVDEEEGEYDDFEGNEQNDVMDDLLND